MYCVYILYSITILATLNQSWLCAIYTNHVLNQFLERILHQLNIVRSGDHEHRGVPPNLLENGDECRCDVRTLLSILHGDVFREHLINL